MSIIAQRMDIVSFFCERRNVPSSDVMSDARHGRVPYTRFMIWLYLHYGKGMSASDVARMFNRSRACVFRGMRTLKYQMRHDRKLKAEYQSILKEIEGASTDTPSGNME